MNYGNFLLMDNEHMKLLVIKQLKGCKFMPKCTKIHLVAGKDGRKSPLPKVRLSRIIR